MGRTGEGENKQANKDYTAQGKESFDKAQGGVNDYNKNLTTIESGKDIGANPWKSADYLASQNRLQSDSLNAVGNANDASLRDVEMRSGGLNAGSTRAASSGLSLERMRLADELSAGRTAADHDKNVGYQNSLMEAPLAVTRAESPYYGTATSGRGKALDNLTQFGLQSQGFWNNLAMMGVKAAAGGVSGGLAGTGAAAGVLSSLGGGK